MTFLGFLLVLFFGFGIYSLLFRRDDCTFTEEDIDELIRELEEEKKELRSRSTEP